MANWAQLFDSFRPKVYARRHPLILINGLAEQPESWFRNRKFWSRYFDVHVPNVLVYDGTRLHEMIERKHPITVDHLVTEFHQYITRYVQSQPVHVVSSSLGGKIAVELAVRYPELVNRMVLLCPSGMGDEERLPIMEGMRGDTYSLIRSVFHKPKFVDRDMLKYYKAQMQNRRWKTGLVRAVRGTLEYTVRDKLKGVKALTLMVTGQHDKICDPATSAEAAKELPHGYFLQIAKCGHAPQIEKHRLINRLVVRFLNAPNPSTTPDLSRLLLAKPLKVSQ
jgi:pimeloyl-ACP methyl ester carboxylesterase